MTFCCTESSRRSVHRKRPINGTFIFISKELPGCFLTVGRNMKKAFVICLMLVPVLIYPTKLAAQKDDGAPKKVTTHVQETHPPLRDMPLVLTEAIPLEKVGKVYVFDGNTYNLIATVDFEGGADNLPYDAAAKRVYVACGDGEKNRAIATIDAVTNQRLDTKNISWAVSQNPSSWRNRDPIFTSTCHR